MKMQTFWLPMKVELIKGSKVAEKPWEGKGTKKIPVHGNPGDKEIMNTCTKFFSCSIISFTCATWMQDDTQSRTLSSGVETLSSADSV